MGMGGLESLKRAVKEFLPAAVMNRYNRWRSQANHRDFNTLTPREAFDKIYMSGLWGRSEDNARPFFSGAGSHDVEMVTTYVQAVSSFLSSLPKKPNVADLGCGDFNVGSKLRPWCDDYIACDVVERLISFNKTAFMDLNVDFRVLDLTTDEIPEAEVIFVREVFQHLSNDMIARALPKIAKACRYLVFTESIPHSDHFKANIDKPVGPDVRTRFMSAVVLTKPPFNFVPKQERVICEAKQNLGRVRTILYEV